MGLNLKKKAKRLVKKLTPKPLRRVHDHILNTFIDPKKATKKLLKDGKSIIRAPGKWMKPKKPPKAAVIETEDEERTGMFKKARRAARRGARSQSMLSDQLG